MKNFCFTIDDNIRFFKEIYENKNKSIFEHPYLSMLLRLNKRFGLKVQLNLFYKTENFDLSMMSDMYKAEWENNSDWLKLSFHSEYENESPYAFSGYDEVYDHCKAVNGAILRFASETSLAKTTTIHYCAATDDGVLAVKDNGYKGLLGLYGEKGNEVTSYNLPEEYASRIRNGETVAKNGISFAPIDIVLNMFSTEQILDKLLAVSCRDNIWVMIHEQYFYPDYPYYQSDFEDKLSATFECLNKNGYKSMFFEELI